MRPEEEIDVQGKKLNFNCYLDVYCMVVSKIEVLGLGEGWQFVSCVSYSDHVKNISVSYSVTRTRHE